MNKTAHAYGYHAARFLLYLVTGVVLGGAVMILPLKAIAALVCGAFILFAVVSRPEFCIIIIVVLISSVIFEESLPLVRIGVGSLHVSDVLLLALLMTVGFRSYLARDDGLVRTKLDRPMVLFLSVAVFSALVAIVVYGVDFNMVMRTLRPLCYYALFFVITNLIVEKRQITIVIKGLIVTGAVVGLVMIAQSIIGDAVLLMPGRVENAGTLDEEFDVLRILPPGQTLLYLLSIALMSILAFADEMPVLASRSFYAMLTVWAGVILTYNRSYWVAILLAIILLLFLIPASGRKRVMAVLAFVIIAAACAGGFLAGTSSRFNETMLSVTSRFTSLGKGDELSQSGPLEDRLTENGFALKKIAEHPLLGIGLGNEYRPAIYGPDDDLTYYVHNGYLWIMLDMGIGGVFCFLWLYLLFLYRGFRNWRSVDDRFFRGVVLGFTLGGVGIMPMALVNPVFMQWFSIVVLAVMFGINESILRFNGPLSQNPDAQ